MSLRLPEGHLKTVRDVLIRSLVKARVNEPVKVHVAVNDHDNVKTRYRSAS